MNVKLLKLVFTVGILSFIFIVSIQAEVINDNVTGEFESDGNFLEILSKPNNKIKFYLLAFWKAHIGEVCGTIPINNGKAVYKKGNCEITMIFSGNTIKVTQKGYDVECDFGANVTARGIYKRINNKIPTFDHCE